MNKINSIIKDFKYIKLEKFGMYEITLILNTDEIITHKIFISDDINVENYINTYLMYLF
jgi:hypothetical protein